jgi:hypothetical protein
MSLHVPELPFQIDPLIAEAKRRARRRRLFELAALVAVAVVASSLARGALAHPAAGGRVASSGRQCAASDTYGKQCIAVIGAGRKVTAIRTSFDNTALLYQHRWRIDLERYSCNPVGQTRMKCSAVSTWHGRAHESVSTPGNRYPNRVRTDSWPSFGLPHVFASNGWLCTEVAVYNPSAGKWVYNAAGLTRGLRACAAVHA